jgi:N-acetylneuraminic acid mutarotase
LHSYSQDKRRPRSQTGFSFATLIEEILAKNGDEMKRKSKISDYIIRSAAYVVFLSVAFIAASSGFQLPNEWYKSLGTSVGYSSTAKSPIQPRAFSFAERVAYQRAIEDVYWRHRIWPKENPDRKPALDAVMSQAQLENKVRGYLHDSLVLQDYWQRPITTDQLQAEMNRMARDTRQPEVLRELFEALGNEPAVIAECLARPILAERSMADFSARGQTRHIGSSETDMLRTISLATTLGQFAYTLPKIADPGNPPCTDHWAATTNFNVPSPRSYHTAVWTGSEMIVWGGTVNTGGRYNPTTDSWTATSTTNAPSGRYLHTAVWTGGEMIVWGGYDGNFHALNTGGRYNPSTNSWTPTNTTNAPSERAGHTAVWTGSEMIVWGGYNSGSYFNTGGRYDPRTNTWTATGTTHAPSGQEHPTSVWTGMEMIVWGGIGGGGRSNTGGRYDPGTNTWRPTSRNNAPTARYAHTAIWTGNEMIVWGGSSDSDGGNTGGRYSPSTNAWTTTSTTNAPYASFHTAVWTGSEMIVWGGVGYYSLQNTGGRYDPGTDAWRATSSTNAPDARYAHTAIWTGREMIVWGGDNGSLELSNGGRYCAQSGSRPTQLGNISTRAFVQTGDNVVIGGFIIQGTESKTVIIRAIGPELTQYGVPNALANPSLELHDATGALIASNNNWATTIIGGIITADQFHDIVTSGYAPSNGFESAIIADLVPGNYTAVIRGVNNTTGVGLVEAYDFSPDSNSILGNISTRSLVQNGDNVMIGGLIVQGTQSKRVVIRAIGPELTQYEVPNVLANPTLELHDSTGALIASNDNWQQTIVGGIITGDQRLAIHQSGHAPGSLLESALIADLPAGNYTAIVRGVNNTTGVALVEVYDLGE